MTERGRTAVRQAVARLDGFFGWWTGQLAWFVPTGLRRAVAGRGQLVVATLAEEGAELSLESRGTVRPLGRIGPGGPARNSPEGRLCRRPVALRLPCDRALRTTFALPAAVEENLAEVLRFELDRRTPFSPEDVRYAWRVVDRDSAAATVRIELTLVPRDDIAAALRLAGRLGLTPRSLEVEPDEPEGARSANLLPDLASTRRPWRGLASAAAAAGLAVTVLIPLHQAHQEALRLDREVALAKAEAEKAVRTRGAIDGLAESRDFLQRAKRSQWTATEILAEVSRLLPDDSWLSELSVTAGEVRLKGYSASSSALIRSIGQSRLLASLRFAAPVVQDPATGRERFEITASLSGRPAP